MPKLRGYRKALATWAIQDAAVEWLRKHGVKACRSDGIVELARKATGKEYGPAAARKVLVELGKQASSKPPPKAMASGFYHSQEWLTLRYEVLKESNGLCSCCGRGRKDGAILHVDHIKPRSRYPHLALVKSNMQVLCDSCNIGKGAWDSTDWRDK